MTEWWPETHDQVLRKEPLRELRDLAKSEQARVVWRHSGCGRVVAVVRDTPDLLLTTYASRLRVMLGSDREAAHMTNSAGDGYLISAIEDPLPVHVRCCGTPAELPWADLWADVEKGRRESRVVRRDVDFNP